MPDMNNKNEFSRKQELTLEWSNLLGRNIANLQKFYALIWRNVRTGGGLRLTQYGVDILDELKIHKWTIKIKNTNRTGATVLHMDRYLDSPYAIDNRKNSIIVYDEQLAAQLMLYDGDLAAFLDAFVISK